MNQENNHKKLIKTIDKDLVLERDLTSFLSTYKLNGIPVDEIINQPHSACLYWHFFRTSEIAAVKGSLAYLERIKSESSSSPDPWNLFFYGVNSMPGKDEFDKAAKKNEPIEILVRTGKEVALKISDIFDLHASYGEELTETVCDGNEPHQAHFKITEKQPYHPEYLGGLVGIYTIRPPRSKRARPIFLYVQGIEPTDKR